MIRTGEGLTELPKGTKIPTTLCHGCGLKYKDLPFIGQRDKSGIWFNCKCGSTTVIRQKRLDEVGKSV